MPQQLQDVEQDATIKGKTVISFNHPTPKWATWIFRTEFVLNKALTMYLSGTALIPADKLKEWFLIMSIIDFITWFSARSVGVKKADFEQYTNE